MISVTFYSDEAKRHFFTRLKIIRERRKKYNNKVLKAKIIPLGVFIPVMDTDPVMAARCLTFTDLKKAIDTIAYSLIYAHKDIDGRFKYIEDEDKLNYICYDVIRSTSNLYYFSKMYEELQSIHEEYTGKKRSVNKEFKEEFLYDSNFLGCKKDPLYFRSIDSAVADTIFFRRHKSKSYIGRPLINACREVYLHENYTYDKFPAGAPRWYVLTKKIIFQKYDMLSRKQVRITRDENGVYRYYIAYISNDWQEVENVPPEMRDVLDAVFIANRTDREV